MEKRAGIVVRTEDGSSFLIVKSDTNMEVAFLVSLDSFELLVELLDSSDLEGFLDENGHGVIVEQVPFADYFAEKNKL